MENSAGTFLPAHLYRCESPAAAQRPIASNQSRPALSSHFTPHHSPSPLSAPPSSPHLRPTDMDPPKRLPTVAFIASPIEQPRKIELYTPQFYGASAVGGILACGLTHMAVTPFDVAKCNIQIDPKKYNGTFGAFRTIVQEQSFVGLTRGWVPTLLGYSAQGACKYGFYEYFKKLYTDIAGPEAGKKYKTALYLAGSASAEVIADIALCPFEAVKVRVQTQPGFAKGLADGLPKLVRMEGIAGLYKGIGPLWARQVPYTMMKFATFENTVEAFYTHVVPYPKEECSVLTQLGISFTSGYIAGVGCAVVSHPADNLVSFLNNSKGATVAQAMKEMGMWTLFTRGLPLRIAMVGTLTAAQWSIYDSFKVFMGFPTTGGSSSHDSKETLGHPALL
ncbi:hypothetical protein KP509_22G055900 [Ceratopteris richardii]|uniref:Uncharacterized protein n=1 Tax=Ceratopteris richardii TaxID=49495 RepID=A0A8T2S5E3_CERRI|nr:hypothetical protein KP509_22G055900 [Ceratopteris richardii]